MAFNDLQLKVAAESGIQAAHVNLAKLGLFAKSYSELQGVYGQAIAVPVYDLEDADDFDADSNNYGSGENEVEGKTITLDQHLVKSVAISDKQLAETGINWVKDTTAAIADQLTRAVNKYVFKRIVLAPESGDAYPAVVKTFGQKSDIADLYKAAADNDLPVDRCIVALNATNFAKVLSQLDSNVYGGSEAVRMGCIPGLYGFKAFVCNTFWNEGITGAIIPDNAIGVAARYLAPSVPGAYPESWMASDGDIMPLGFRRFMDLSKGVEFLAGDVLFGATVFDQTKIVRVKAS